MDDKSWPAIIFLILIIIILIGILFSKTIKSKIFIFFVLLIFSIFWFLFLLCLCRLGHHALGWFFLLLPIFLIVLLWISIVIASHTTDKDFIAKGII